MERIERTFIEEEMEQSYINYAMSVIIARALPDVRDGLKPVHRRILFAMHDMGIGPNSSHKKSARIVGEVDAPLEHVRLHQVAGLHQQDVPLALVRRHGFPPVPESSQ